MMIFDWIDYACKDANLVDQWLDDAAIAMTGIDSGWDKYWNEVIADSVNYPGCRDFCKLVRVNGVPIAAVVFGCYCGTVTISEIVLDPSLRSMGYGSQIIRELVTHGDVWFDGEPNQFRAVIFSDNLASQRAFQKAGFVSHPCHDAFSLEYIYKV